MQSTYPYFISVRRTNREWFPTPIELTWELFSNHLFLLHHGFNFKIHAAVLMSNHYHFIASTPEANVSSGMAYFQREFSKSISRECGRINQIFGRPYHPCVLDSYYYYMNAYKYLYRNPIKAGLAHRVEEYRFSTMYGLLGQSHLLIPVEEDTLLFTPYFNSDHLIWLNQGKDEDYLEVQAALRKREFRFPKNDDTGKPVRDDDFVF